MFKARLFKLNVFRDFVLGQLVIIVCSDEWILRNSQNLSI